MENDKRSGKSSHGKLSAEDAELWQRVAGTAKPLKKGKNRAVDLPAPPRQDAPRPAEPDSHAAPEKQSTPERPPKPAPPPAPPPLAAYDRREARGLASGREAIDARIDLHGMRQREAHAALRAFIARASARGHRHVLVITGKGGEPSEERVGERGVLNRHVPLWLAEPAFREWVVGFAPAHRRHGGEGALYVRLRRSKPA